MSNLMTEPTDVAGDLAVEICITTGNDAQDTLVEDVLELLDVSAWVLHTLSYVDVQQPLQVMVSVIGDEVMQSLNKTYRHQDKTTDVLSFPLLDEPLVEAPAELLWQLPEP